jgi:hypothetical protein
MTRSSPMTNSRPYLPVHDRHLTPSLNPKEAPEFETAPKSAGVIEVKFRRIAGRAKPPGVKTIEICMAVSDSPTRRVDGTPRKHLRYPFAKRITRNGHERNKWLHLAGRWVNTRGVKGPWSSIISGLIP